MLPPGPVATTVWAFMEPATGVSWKAVTDPPYCPETVWLGVVPLEPLTVAVWVLSAKAAAEPTAVTVTVKTSSTVLPLEVPVTVMVAVPFWSGW